MDVISTDVLALVFVALLAVAAMLAIFYLVSRGGSGEVAAMRKEIARLHEEIDRLHDEAGRAKRGTNGERSTDFKKG